jgi:hypothetical protein
MRREDVTVLTPDRVSMHLTRQGMNYMPYRARVSRAGGLVTSDTTTISAAEITVMRTARPGRRCPAGRASRWRMRRASGSRQETASLHLDMLAGARFPAVERKHALGEHRRQRENLRVAGHDGGHGARGDGSRFYGFSWGACLGAILPAVEQRFKVNVLMGPGLYLEQARPEVDPINFAPRVMIPR